jgi:hypothetical protein
MRKLVNIPVSSDITSLGDIDLGCFDSNALYHAIRRNTVTEFKTILSRIRGQLDLLTNEYNKLVSDKAVTL